MAFITKNFLAIIILLLVVVLLANRCDHNTTNKPTIVIDTVWVKHDSIVTSKPQLVKVISTPIEKIITNIQYKPDTNYQALLKQYNALLTLYFNKNIQKDTLKLNKLGYISVTDTVYNNLITGRVYDYHITYPEITKSITRHTNQLYIGGGLEGNRINLVNQINLGLLLKNKKDQVFGASIGLNQGGVIQYSINSYWKIKL
jgi:hypothetical protein